MALNRRQFLRRSAIAVAGATLSRPNLVETAAAIITRGPAKKIVILGAGMAGLSAGYELTQLGHEVTILEARMRPGGRVYTLREPFSDGLYAEAGAARFPDSHDLTIKYAKVFGLPLEPMYPERLSNLRFDRGSRQEVSTESFTEALGQHFGADLGGDPKISHKIKGGSDLLPKALAQQLAEKIHYGTPVVKIQQDSEGTRVVALQAGKPQTFSADRVLCTIPFSVLRNIDLPPTLGERKRSVIKNTRYEAVSRVYLQMKTRSWESKGLTGFALTRDSIEVWHPTWNQRGPRGILMTYARGSPGERIGGLKEAERISTTLAQLDGIFPGLRDQFEGGTSKVWHEDEWSRGAWALVDVKDFVVAPGAGDRIHFAGEHLSNWASWIQGAISSSLRAVKEIEEAQ